VYQKTQVKNVYMKRFLFSMHSIQTEQKKISEIIGLYRNWPGRIGRNDLLLFEDGGGGSG